MWMWWFLQKKKKRKKNSMFSFEAFTIWISSETMQIKLQAMQVWQRRDNNSFLKRQREVTGWAFSGVEVVLGQMKSLIWWTAHHYQNVPREAEGLFSGDSWSQIESTGPTESQLSHLYLDISNSGKVATQSSSHFLQRGQASILFVSIHIFRYVSIL